MFCGFSSSAVPYSGSTRQKPGSVPAAASVKNPAMGTIFVPWFLRNSGGNSSGVARLVK